MGVSDFCGLNSRFLQNKFYSPELSRQNRVSETFRLVTRIIINVIQIKC